MLQELSDSDSDNEGGVRDGLDGDASNQAE